MPERRQCERLRLREGRRRCALRDRPPTSNRPPLRRGVGGVGAQVIRAAQSAIARLPRAEAVPAAHSAIARPPTGAGVVLAARSAIARPRRPSPPFQGGGLGGSRPSMFSPQRSARSLQELDLDFPDTLALGMSQRAQQSGQLIERRLASLERPVRQSGDDRLLGPDFLTALPK